MLSFLHDDNPKLSPRLNQSESEKAYRPSTCFAQNTKIQPTRIKSQAQHPAMAACAYITRAPFRSLSSRYVASSAGSLAHRLLLTSST